MQPGSAEAIERYLASQRIAAGQQRQYKLPSSSAAFGLSPEQVGALGASKQPFEPTPSEPGMFNKAINAIGRPIGFYVTQALPDLAEWLTSPIVDDLIGLTYGDKAKDDYRKARATTANEIAKE